MPKCLIFLIILIAASVHAQNEINIKIILIGEENHGDFSLLVGKVVVNIQNTYKNLQIDAQLVLLNRQNEMYSYNRVCNLVETMGVTVFIDMTTPGWTRLQEISEKLNTLYFRIDVSNLLFVKALYNYFEYKKSSESNALLVLPSQLDVNLVLSYFTENENDMDLIIVSQFDLSLQFLSYLKKLNPPVQQYGIILNSLSIPKIYNLFHTQKFMYNYTQWNWVAIDFKSRTHLADIFMYEDMSLIYPQEKYCCLLQGYQTDCVCSERYALLDNLFAASMQYIVKIIYQQFKKYNTDITYLVTKCENLETQFNVSLKEMIQSTVFSDIKTSEIFSYDSKLFLFDVKLMLDIVKYNYKGAPYVFGNWSREYGIQINNQTVISKAQRFFSIGTIEYVPWAYRMRSEETNQLILDANKQPIWTGYCIDLLRDISLALNFDYEIVVPKDGAYGQPRIDRRTNTIQWNGLIGELMNRTIDMAFAALTLSEEREDVVDFVSPYFGFTGHTLVIRKTYRTTSIFKFMTVLKLEVWLSILGALSITAILIWALEKLSPYSAKNRKSFYTEPCRDFTLKESFWFALTSFTPQGGGETPKALSGRAVVASYWLFVVLMLATFTANLAAFLTVERMQTPVQSLDQLVRQKLINYTVVVNSTTYRFIESMKNAEENLYQVWKDLALNLDHDQDLYQVWDYPIAELYFPLMDSLYNYGSIKTSKQGFETVLEHQNSDFILIHDSAEIEYQISRNCNLTTIGQPFGEHPYAIAVQQGSPLQNEIGQLLSEWQKYRYFENLKNKYWNYSVRGECPNSADSEGITLRSLGGVFIATIFGLFISMCTLGVEVFYLRRKEKNKITNEGNSKANANKSLDQSEEVDKEKD